MDDSTEFRYDFSGTGHDTCDYVDVAFAIMNNKYNYSSGYITQVFNPVSSAIKGSRGAIVDKLGAKQAAKLASGAKKWVPSGVLTIGKYVDNPGLVEKIRTKSLGLVGSIGFTAKDVISSVSSKQYVGACMDMLSGCLGVGVGGLLEYIGGGIIAAGLAPEIIVTGGVIFTGIGSGIAIDYGSTGLKNEY
ncbi:hypothetical protein [Clostridium sp. C8-1-8]|uniref:hypothetical protein n=1 Tax=Clostridium sp. C8-1-8 TaxID=2698831 RepID=UPI001FAB6A3E|nr:hypothetical protein [Clostridium sp. C8-1-8]